MQLELFTLDQLFTLVGRIDMLTFTTSLFLFSDGDIQVEVPATSEEEAWNLLPDYL